MDGAKRADIVLWSSESGVPHVLIELKHVRLTSFKDYPAGLGITASKDEEEWTDTKTSAALQHLQSVDVEGMMKMQVSYNRATKRPLHELRDQWKAEAVGRDKELARKHWTKMTIHQRVRVLSVILLPTGQVVVDAVSV